jgi:septum formation protein
MTYASPRALVLGSTSAYRRALLERLRIPFTVVAPDVDEATLAGETPEQTAIRLALAKAHAVAQGRENSVVIGSDQVADLHGEAIGKPGNFERARNQLQRMSGQTVVFHTAVAVVCPALQFVAQALVPVQVKFRTLSELEINHYLLAETPYDCAGSAKSEGLGIALLERIDNSDPSALVGLPLIETARMLRAAGIPILGSV